MNVLDCDGALLKKGSSVLFIFAPNELLSGLPLDDQIAIKSQAGKIMTVQGFDSLGNVELEFSDCEGILHFIYVKPECLRAIE